jgi:cobalt-zinc-cadmium efflux system outer membrane protein
MFRRTAFAVPLAVLWCVGAAEAQTVLTVDRVLELVEQQSPQVLLARARVLQAEGGLTTAQTRLATNPELDLFLGGRDTATGNLLETEFSLLQRFEIGGQRGHRIAGATAAVSQQTFEVSAVALDAQTTALEALYRAAHALEVRRLADDALGLAEESLRAAQARYEAGETAVLDVNVARVEQARARREQLAAAARLEGTFGVLREILALPAGEPLRVDVPFRTPEVPTLEALLARLAERPDVRALSAGVSQADAELQLSRASRTPDLFGGVGLRREEGEPVAGVRIGLSLPLFQRQTGAIATATARLSQARTALEARQRALDARLRAAHAQYTLAAQAADVIASTALPLLAENEGLTRESYQAGKIGLLELLVIQRQGFAARREALDAQLEASIGAIEVRGVAGVIR